MKHILSERSQIPHVLPFGLSFYSLTFSLSDLFSNILEQIYFIHNKMHSLNESFIEGDNNYVDLALHVTAYDAFNDVNPMYDVFLMHRYIGT